MSADMHRMKFVVDKSLIIHKHFQLTCILQWDQWPTKSASNYQYLCRWRNRLRNGQQFPLLLTLQRCAHMLLPTVLVLRKPVQTIISIIGANSLIWFTRLTCGTDTPQLANWFPAWIWSPHDNIWMRPVGSMNISTDKQVMLSDGGKASMIPPCI